MMLRLSRSSLLLPALLALAGLSVADAGPEAGKPATTGAAPAGKPSVAGPAGPASVKPTPAPAAPAGAPTKPAAAPAAPAAAKPATVAAQTPTVRPAVAGPAGPASAQAPVAKPVVARPAPTPAGAPVPATAPAIARPAPATGQPASKIVPVAAGVAPVTPVTPVVAPPPVIRPAVAGPGGPASAQPRRTPIIASQQPRLATQPVMPVTPNAVPETGMAGRAPATELTLAPPPLPLWPAASSTTVIPAKRPAVAGLGGPASAQPPAANVSTSPLAPATRAPDGFAPGKPLTVRPSIAPPRSGGPSADFSMQAKVLFRVAACGGRDPVPATIDLPTVDRHCANLSKRMDDYRKLYLEKARPFFAQLVPTTAPKTVVYPFGGGDLLSALVAFPNATEITTISLEMAGDPRRIDDLDKAKLTRSLGALRGEIGGLLSVGSNTSANLSTSQRNELPAQVSSFLMGLAAAGYEPVGMRYFHIQEDGSLHYLTVSEISAMDSEAASRPRPKSLKASWHSPNFTEAFANVEIQYRRPGESTIRVHRHIGWNLGDDYLAEHPQLLTHLARKGKVTMLTKGGSYLLWLPNFSKIRDYMLGNLAWMLSDSTGIPPAYASAAGMVQEPYGAFSGAFLEGAERSGGKHAAAFRALWQKSPRRPLPVRFGYVDMNKQAHLLVTRPK